MATTTVILDAGHGDTDPGAIYNGRQEKDDALRLTLAVGKILQDNGINVIYTRTSDIYQTPFQKATAANNAKGDYFVSIHRNSSERDNQYQGAESLVYNDNGIKAVMARNINSELENAGFKNLGVDERPNLVVLKRTKMPAVLIEAGFINSDSDNELFDKNFQKIAQGIADGILKSLPKQTTATASSDSISLTNIKNYADSDYNDTNFNNSNYTDTDFNDSGYNTPASNDNMNKDYNPLEYNNSSFDTQMYDSQYNMRENNIYNEPPEKLYRVQTGTFRNKDNADRMLNSLLIEGFPAFIVYDNGIYCVQVGAFRNLFNAIKMEQRLRRFRYNTYISYD